MGSKHLARTIEAAAVYSPWKGGLQQDLTLPLPVGHCFYMKHLEPHSLAAQFF